MQLLKKSLFVSIFATDEVCVSSTLFVQNIGRGWENFWSWVRTPACLPRNCLPAWWRCWLDRTGLINCRDELAWMICLLQVLQPGWTFLQLAKQEKLSRISVKCSLSNTLILVSAVSFRFLLCLPNDVDNSCIYFCKLGVWHLGIFEFTDEY